MKARGYVRDFIFAGVTAGAVAVVYLLGLRSLPSPLLTGAAVVFGVASMFREAPRDLQVTFFMVAATLVALLAWVH